MDLKTLIRNDIKLKEKSLFINELVENRMLDFKDVILLQEKQDILLNFIKILEQYECTQLTITKQSLITSCSLVEVRFYIDRDPKDQIRKTKLNKVCYMDCKGINEVNVFNICYFYDYSVVSKLFKCEDFSFCDFNNVNDNLIIYFSNEFCLEKNQ